MLKKLLITTAVSGLMMTAAYAQTSQSTPNAMQPNASSSGASSSDATKQDQSGMSKSQSSATDKSDLSKNASASGSAKFVASQGPNQLLASTVKGADVMGANNEKIGDVSDIMFTQDGNVDAYIISVGGFLGVGAKEVALAPSSVQISKDAKDDSIKITVSLNKDQLAQAPDFEQFKAQRTTTGAAPSSSNMAPKNDSMAPKNSAPAK